MELLLMVILSAEKILINLEGMRSHLKLLLNLKVLQLTSKPSRLTPFYNKELKRFDASPVVCEEISRTAAFYFSCNLQREIENAAS
jgi:hypothetical protein